MGCFLSTVWVIKGRNSVKKESKAQKRLKEKVTRLVKRVVLKQWFVATNPSNLTFNYVKEPNVALVRYQFRLVIWRMSSHDIIMARTIEDATSFSKSIIRSTRVRSYNWRVSSGFSFTFQILLSFLNFTYNPFKTYNTC